jgi:exopolysaccharide biosynthesis polyprenyl glycosylphosphotransferase
MLGRQRLPWVVRLAVLDVLILGLAFGGAWGARRALDPWFSRPAGPPEHYLWLLPWFTVLWLALLALRGGYGLRWLDGRGALARLIVEVSAGGLLLAAAALFALQARDVNRTLLALYGVLAAVGLGAGRGLLRWWLRHGRRAEARRQVLVVGTGAGAARVVEALARYPETGWVVRGCVAVEPVALGTAVGGVPVVGLLEDLASLLESGRVIDEVFFAASRLPTEALREALAVCEGYGIDARVLLDLYQPRAAVPFVEELFGLQFHGFSPTLTRQGALALKRVLDVTVAGLLLLVAAPLLLLLGLGVRLSSPGPALFRQVRAGLHGRPFRLYKLRTMVVDAERRRDEVDPLNVVNGPAFKAPDDPRVTGLGRWLRRASLDELPQLWNVLRGEMSLVGPRPLPLVEAAQLKGAQRRRLAMRPGLTGLWQVSGRSQLEFERWMALDLAYVDGWSLGLDLRILLRTLPAVLTGRGAM